MDDVDSTGFAPTFTFSEATANAPTTNGHDQRE